MSTEIGSVIDGSGSGAAALVLVVSWGLYYTKYIISNSSNKETDMPSDAYTHIWYYLPKQIHKEVWHEIQRQVFAYLVATRAEEEFTADTSPPSSFSISIACSSKMVCDRVINKQFIGCKHIYDIYIYDIIHTQT